MCSDFYNNPLLHEGQQEAGASFHFALNHSDRKSIIIIIVNQY